MQRQDSRDKRAGDKMTGKDSWKKTTRTGQPEKESWTGQPARKVRMVQAGQERADGTARTRQQRQDSRERTKDGTNVAGSPMTVQLNGTYGTGQLVWLKEYKPGRNDTRTGQRHQDSCGHGCWGMTTGPRRPEQDNYCRIGELGQDSQSRTAKSG